MHYVSIKPIGSQPSPQHIRGSITDENNEYLLEIANFCQANHEVLAFAAMEPEIRAYLELADCPLAKMLLEQLARVSMSIYRDQVDPAKPD